MYGVLFAVVPSTPIPAAAVLHCPRIPVLPARRRASNLVVASSAVPFTDRLISACTYALPFLNSLSYGRFLFARYPTLAAPLLSPFVPLASALHSFPYAAFVAFFALYLGVARNRSLSRYARFNAMQAIVLDVLLALPALLQRLIIGGAGMAPRGLGFRVMEVLYGLVFGFAALCFVYSVAFCVIGRTPSLPLVADAADRQL